MAETPNGNEREVTLKGGVFVYQDNRIQVEWVDWQSLLPRGWKFFFFVAIFFQLLSGWLLSAPYGSYFTFIVWARLFLALSAYAYDTFFVFTAGYRFATRMFDPKKGERKEFSFAFMGILVVAIILWILVPVVADLTREEFEFVVAPYLYR